MKKFENILWGLVLIIIGSIIGLNTMGITNINIFFDGWWTLFIIVPSFIGLFSSKDKTVDFIGIFVGISLLLACQHIIDFTILWQMLLPIILIIIGISLICKNIFINNKITINSNNKYMAIFSSQNIDFTNEKVKNTQLQAIFGSIKCDMQNANITNDITINAKSIFGGIELLLNKEISVKVKVIPIFGGVQNKTLMRSNAKHTVYINAFCLFGGIKIK